MNQVHIKNIFIYSQTNKMYNSQEEVSLTVVFTTALVGALFLGLVYLIFNSKTAEPKVGWNNGVCFTGCRIQEEQEMEAGDKEMFKQIDLSLSGYLDPIK
jgi:hypothetical protein